MADLIYREVVVLGVNSQETTKDFKTKPTITTVKNDKGDLVEKKVWAEKLVVPVSLLVGFEEHNVKNGYIGTLRIIRYDCDVANTDHLKKLTVNSRCLVGFKQSIYDENSDKAGRVYEDIVSIRPMVAAG